MMPRRNRNASARPASTDALDGQLAELQTGHHAPGRLAVPFAACRVNPATTGDYCALCKGRITRSARRTALRRR